MSTRRAGIAAGLMGLGALAAWQLTPRRPLAERHGAVQLDSAVPRRFGAWTEDPRASAAIVNPQQEALLRSIYSQQLSRVYVNPQGEAVMLVIAYGSDQRDNMQVHYPEVCYPAQGFEVRSSRPVDWTLGEHRLPVRQLETAFGNSLREAVTYWVVIGDEVVRGGNAKKRAELRWGLRGWIPDGMLVRVSTRGPDAARGFALQKAFTAELIPALRPADRLHTVGAPVTTAPLTDR